MTTGYEGREAEGRDAAWFTGRGSNRNIFVGNDLSHCAAHGLEMTFVGDHQPLEN